MNPEKVDKIGSININFFLFYLMICYVSARNINLLVAIEPKILNVVVFCSSNRILVSYQYLKKLIAY